MICAALSALPLEHCLPDLARLTATLKALNPVLSGEECGPAAWVFGTSMPSRDWVLRAHALRKEVVQAPTEELPDASLVQATALAPELGKRMLDDRRVYRFLRRHPVFDGVHGGLGTGAGRSFRFVDATLADGRWGRLRGTLDMGDHTPSADEVEAWFALSFDELIAAIPALKQRTVVGPLWQPGGESGADDFGLVMCVESLQGLERHVAVPAHLARRARADGLGTVHSFTLPR